MNYLVKVLVGIQGVSTSGCIFHQTLCEAVSVTPCNHNCDYYFCNIVKICYLVPVFPKFSELDLLRLGLGWVYLCVGTHRGCSTSGISQNFGIGLLVSPQGIGCTMWLFPVVPRSPVAVGQTVFSTSTVDTYLWTLLTLLTLVVVGLSVNPAHVCSMVMVITHCAIIIIWALPSPV